MNILEIKNVPNMLREIGKIKIGKKGAIRSSGEGKTFQQPTKLKHFLVTTNERGADGNYVEDTAIMEKLGKEPKEIPVMLLYDDITLNFQCRYAIFNGTKCVMQGDGEKWHWLQENGTWKEGSAPIKQLEKGYKGKDKCKVNGTLSVIIRNAEVVGGIWKFRTTGVFSAWSIYNSLKLIAFVTGGHLAGIPLFLTVSPQTGTDAEGNMTTFSVVNIVFKGNPDALREMGLSLIKSDITWRHRIENIEQEVKKELMLKQNAFDEDPLETIEEFYPEEAEAIVQEYNEAMIMNKIGQEVSDGEHDDGRNNEKNEVSSGSVPQGAPYESGSSIHGNTTASNAECRENTGGDLPPKGDGANYSNGSSNDVSESEDKKDNGADAKASGETSNSDKKEEKPKKPRAPRKSTTSEKSSEEPKNDSKEPPKVDESSKPAEKTQETAQKSQTNGVMEDKPPKSALPPEQQVKVLLFDAGLDSDDLRHAFYKKYPMKPEDYLAKPEMLATNLDLFKKNLILSLKSHIPAMIAKLEIDEAGREKLENAYEKTDKNNFSEMVQLYVDLKR